MTMQKALHPRDDIVSVYQEKNRGDNSSTLSIVTVQGPKKYRKMKKDELRQTNKKQQNPENKNWKKNKITVRIFHVMNWDISFGLLWFELFWFYGISTIIGYLMPRKSWPFN